MEIFAVKEENLKEILEISREVFEEESWNERQFEEAFKTGRSIFLFAKEKGEAVAFLLAEDLIDSVNLLLIATDEKYRNKKIATKLILELEKITKNKKINKIWLEVKENNYSAINFYKKNNFENIYLRRNYYKNGISALIFEKILI